MMSSGWWPSTLQPTVWPVPKISLRVPESPLAKGQYHICWAMLIMSSKVILPLCLMLFRFFLSLNGSLRALMIRAETEGTASIRACLHNGFHCDSQALQPPAGLGMSSPTFLKTDPGADLRGQGRGSADLPISAPQVHKLDLVVAELGQHGGYRLVSDECFRTAKGGCTLTSSELHAHC